MDPWQVWLLVGLVLMATEVLTGGFFLLLFGIACLAGAGADWAGLGLKLQCVTVATAALATLVGVRPFLLRWTQVPEQPSNVDALVGRSGTVVQAAAAEQAARVKLGGEDWRARHCDGKPLAVGTAVCVEAVEGATLVVRFTEADDLETAGD